MIKCLNMTLCFSASLLATAAPALADIGYHGHEAKAGETISEAITFSDLDLADEEGREVLAERVKRAVDRICPPNRSMQNGKDWRNFKRDLAACRASAHSQIEPKVQLAIRKASQAEQATKLAELDKK